MPKLYPQAVIKPLQSLGDRATLHSMLIRYLLLLVSACSISTTSHAQLADVSCDDSARMTNTLKNVMRAERQGMGFRDRETMLEVWVAKKSREWIIVQNYANGTSCIVAMGDHWESNRLGPA